MTTEIFLVAPAADADLADRLPHALASTEVAALLLRRSGLAEGEYSARAAALIPLIQAAGAAVLVEGEPALARALGADGLHVTAGPGAVRAAIAALKPDLIVGVGDLGSRHLAMEQGELGIDYVLFGPLSGTISADERELARWWAETMQVPSVLSDPEAGIDGFEAEGCEFIGLPLRALEARK